MAEFKLGRLKFVWKGTWADGTTYTKDDIVRNGGKTYVCVLGHVASSDFPTDLSASYWEIMSDGFAWRSNWASSEYYRLNDVVRFGANAYVCILAHTSSANFATDEDTKWERFVEGTQFEDTWSGATQYQNGDLVSYGGYTYIALKTNTNVNPATNVQDPGISDKTWNLHSIGYRNRGTWSTSSNYLTGDVVQHGGNTYVCVKDNNAQAPTDNTTYWTIILNGQRPVGEWNSYTAYKINDIVSYGGNLYKASDDSTAEIPSVDASAFWDLYLTGYKIIGTYTIGGSYKAGEVVQYGGNVYQALVDTANAPTDVTDWQLASTGIKWQGAWTLGTVYKLNEAVKYGTTSYICIQQHTATNGSDRPDNDSTETYWNALSEGDVSNAFSAEGDLLYYGSTSTQNLAIGTANQVLQVNSGATAPEWTDTPTLASLNVLESVTIDDAGDGGNLLIGPGASNLLVQESDDIITLDIVSASKVEQELTFTYTNGTAVDLIPVSVTAWDVEITGASVTAINGTWGIREFDKAANTFRITVPELSGTGSVSLTGATITLLAPTALSDTLQVIVGEANAFVQSALKNLSHGSSSSADFIVYADNGDNDSGWIDIGITSSGFDATSGFGITDVNDGYIFMSAPENTTGPGNLVIATDANGTENDIVFCTGGFDITTNTDAEKVRIVGEARTGSPAGMVIAIDTASDSPTTGALRVQGGIGLQGSLNLEGEIQAFGGTIYQGRKSLGGGLFENAKELTNDVDVTDVTSELAAATITKSGSTLTIVYTVGSTALAAAVVGGTISFSAGTFVSPNDALLAYNAILTHDTVTRTMTLDVQGLTGTGSVTMPGDLEAYYYGPDSYVGLTNASGIFTGDADGFVQFALKNHSTATSASTDIIAYASNGDNESGWIDMGITSENYADATYGVTGPDDGYIFMSARRGSTGNGNLYLSTSEHGEQNDVVFSTDGFASGNERMRIVGVDRPGSSAGVEIYAPTESVSSTTGALRIDGGVGLQGNLNVGGNVNIVGTITVGGSGSSLETENLEVSNAVIFFGSGNAGDTLDLGAVGEYSTFTLLDGGIDADDTTITVDDTTAFPSAATIIIDTEQITYTGKTGTTFTGCARGVGGTTAAIHADNAAVRYRFYSGLVRNNGTDGWELFTGLTERPTNTTNFSASSYDHAALKLGSLNIVDTTATTTHTDGALIVGGGVGIAGAVYTNSTGTFASGIQNTAIGSTTRSSGAFTTLAANAATTLTSSLQVDGITTLSNISEKTEDLTTATGVVTHDMSTTSIWYHSTMSANFTANFTNVPTTTNRVLSATLFLSQGATARLPTAVQIDGAAQTIKWAGNVQPTPVANKTEICVFTLIRTSGDAWVVLGQLSSYG